MNADTLVTGHYVRRLRQISRNAKLFKAKDELQRIKVIFLFATLKRTVRLC